MSEIEDYHHVSCEQIEEISNLINFIDAREIDQLFQIFKSIYSPMNVHRIAGGCDPMIFMDDICREFVKYQINPIIKILNNSGVAPDTYRPIVVEDVYYDTAFETLYMRVFEPFYKIKIDESEIVVPEDGDFEKERSVYIQKKIEDMGIALPMQNFIPHNVLYHFGFLKINIDDS